MSMLTRLRPDSRAPPREAAAPGPAARGPTWTILERVAQQLPPLIAAVCCYGGAIVFSGPLPDDVAYLCAARAVANGNSPYACNRYIYPPLLAELEAAASHVVSEQTVQSGLRALNVAASLWLVLFALSHWTDDRWRRALAAAVLLWWSPNIADALCHGNLGPLVCALLIWSLSRWNLQPVAAGLALGLSLALKPLGPAAWLLIAAHRPESGRGVPQLKAAAIAALTAAVLCLPGREWLPELAAHTQSYPEALHNVSLQRVAHFLGLSIAPPWQILLVCVSALIYARRAPRSPATLMHLGCASVLLAQPIVWSHTLLLIYPALAAAIGRATSADSATKQARWLRISYVCLGCVCVVEAEMFGDLAHVIARPIAAAVAAVPLGLVLALACYGSGVSACNTER